MAKRVEEELERRRDEIEAEVGNILPPPSPASPAHRASVDPDPTFLCDGSGFLNSILKMETDCKIILNFFLMLG